MTSGAWHAQDFSLVPGTASLDSRIEGLTKAYGIPILMGEELAQALPAFATLEVDRVRVVGRDRPPTIHALLGDEALARSPAFEAFAARHAKLLEAYRDHRWDEAEYALSQNEEAAAG